MKNGIFKKKYSQFLDVNNFLIIMCYDINMFRDNFYLYLAVVKSLTNIFALERSCYANLKVN